MTYKFIIYFGLPGSGKTTYAASIVAKNRRRKRKTFSNVPITGAYVVDPQNDIGKHMIEDCDLIIDEAGLEYNNRKFKSFSDEATYFFKYHRHYRVNVHIFSQGYDDMDKKLRTLASELYLVRRSLIPFHIVLRRIRKRVGINEMTHEIVDAYAFDPFPMSLFSKRIFAPFYYKRFNTLSHKILPPMERKRYD